MAELKSRETFMLSREVVTALRAAAFKHGCTISNYVDCALYATLGLGVRPLPIKANRMRNGPIVGAVETAPGVPPTLPPPPWGATEPAPRVAPVRRDPDAPANWLHLEPAYRELLRWWPEVGTPEAYMRLDDLIAEAHRMATEVRPDGSLVRPRNLWTAIEALCRVRGPDGVSAPRLRAMLMSWRGHWREGRAVQKGEGAVWGVVRREEW